MTNVYRIQHLKFYSALTLAHFKKQSYGAKDREVISISLLALLTGIVRL